MRLPRPCRARNDKALRIAGWAQWQVGARWKVWKTFLYGGQGVKLLFRRKRKKRGKFCRKHKFIKLCIRVKIPLFHRKCGKIGVVHENKWKLVDNFVCITAQKPALLRWKSLQPLKHRCFPVDNYPFFYFPKSWISGIFLWIIPVSFP